MRRDPLPLRPPFGRVDDLNAGHLAACVGDHFEDGMRVYRRIARAREIFDGGDDGAGRAEPNRFV